MIDKVNIFEYMKTKLNIKAIFASVILLIIIYAFKFSSKNNSHIPDKHTGLTKNSLAMYGEYVYNRESCINCHTMVIDSNSSLISLDGVGDKYPYSWQYIHLMDPKTMAPYSEMPAFDKLVNNEIDYQKFKELWFVNNDSKSENDVKMAWKSLSEEMDTIINEVKIYVHETSNIKPSEMIALISYLHQIPRSPVKKYYDSIDEAKIRDKEKIWEGLVLDENSETIKTGESKSKDVISRGKEIFSNNCFVCHGTDGGGIIGPNLTDKYWLHGGNTKDIAESIIFGIPEKGMKSWKYDFSPLEVGQLVAYIHTLKGTKPAISKEKQGSKE